MADRDRWPVISRAAMTDMLLQVQDLRVEFELPGGLFARQRINAVNGVGLCVAGGETIGLVGESGSGKSTVARAIARLVPAAAGRVLLRGQDLLQLQAAQMRQWRRHLQLVFQDPLASLNPRMTVGDALQEPLRIFQPQMPLHLRRARVDAMLERVGLPVQASKRYPREFSGGQCQRVGVARAMMLDPALLICDEPVSSLDVSIQGQIVNLLVDMQRDTNAAMIFISHNLGVVRHIAHRVYVIYRGRIVEHAPSEALFARPQHPYTRALIASIPQIPPAPVAVETAPRDLPQPLGQDSGCAYRGRCAHAREACAVSLPPLAPTAATHWVACLRRGEI